jgi:putative transposase
VPPRSSTPTRAAKFTADDFTQPLQAKGVRVSMDGKGRWVDNVFVERLWRSVKYEDLYLHAYETMRELKAALANYFDF